MAIPKREHNPNVCGLGPETDCDDCRERYRGMYERDARTKDRLDVSATLPARGWYVWRKTKESDYS
jgi:hypothetical protein